MQGIHSIIDTDILRIKKTTTVKEVAEMMSEANTGYTVVEDSLGICGVFSERDIVFRVVAKGLEPAETSISEVMTTDVISVPVGYMLTEARDLMTGHGMRHLLVHDENQKIFGMITLLDVIRVTQDSNDQQVNTDRTLRDLNYNMEVDPEFFNSLPERALVVENSKVLSKLLIKDLTSLGIHDVDVYPNARDAWEVVRKYPEKYQLVICDWGSAKLSGMDFLINIRKLELSSPVKFLMMCQAGQISNSLDAVTFGADNFVIKPVNKKKLQQRLKGVYRRRSTPKKSG